MFPVNYIIIIRKRRIDTLFPASNIIIHSFQIVGVGNPK